MTDEAKIVGEAGARKPEGAGWFVLNAADSRWFGNDTFGVATSFEGKERFEQVGVNIHVLQPGQANCMYHRESDQEGFLVLSGECLLLVEEQERRLKAWDYFHCPPNTTHVFVGAGSGPCAILMVGARSKDGEVHYPVSALARSHGAGVEQATDAPREAYAPFPSWEDKPNPWQEIVGD